MNKTKLGTYLNKYQQKKGRFRKFFNNMSNNMQQLHQFHRNLPNNEIEGENLQALFKVLGKLEPKSHGKLTQSIFTEIWQEIQDQLSQEQNKELARVLQVIENLDVEAFNNILDRIKHADIHIEPLENFNFRIDPDLIRYVINQPRLEYQPQPIRMFDLYQQQQNRLFDNLDHINFLNHINFPRLDINPGEFEHRAPEQQRQQPNPTGVDTHETSITISATESIAKLKQHYPQHNIDKNLKSVSELFDTIQDEGVRITAIAALYRIKTIETTRTDDEANLAEVLSLVWEGIHDESTLPGNENKAEDIATRERALLDNLIDIQTYYGGNTPKCFAGTVNTILETLDKSHPDVNLDHGAAEAFAFASYNLPIIVREALLQKSQEDRQAIINSWDSDEEPATTFIDKIKPIATQKLQVMYPVLTTNHINDITNNIEYLNLEAIGFERQEAPGLQPGPP